MAELLPPAETKFDDSVPDWTVCEGCPFGGEVVEFSVPRYASDETTVLTSDPHQSYGEVMVTYAENYQTAAEKRSGEVRIALGHNSYGSGDDMEAAGIATSMLRRCAEERGIPLTGPRFKALGVGIGTMRACGAFYEQADSSDVPELKPGILSVNNAT